ncbi:MAG: short-chain Z-isoprenyl diphosphate synthase, partial [Pseudonocardiales bacterium]|nr:short-chain Z-isoprenyl diphosphate synthase [Pseudonocardiales bacterium]
MSAAVPLVTLRAYGTPGGHRATVEWNGPVTAADRGAEQAERVIGCSITAIGVLFPPVGLRNLLYSAYERKLRRQLEGAQRPRHVGVILDGNRRWARDAGLLDVNDGHRAGASRITELLGWCRDNDVEVVTLWLLSTDNLNRPDAELRPLLDIIVGVVDELSGPGRSWRVRVVGALDLLPGDTSARLVSAAARTQQRTGMQVNIAVGYGGRREIADAVRKLLLSHAENGTSIEELAEVLDVDHIAEHLYTSGQPDPDLVIRTSGEQRLSG